MINKNMTEYMREYRKKPLQLLRKEVHRLFMIAKREERYNEILIEKELKRKSVRERQEQWKGIKDNSHHYVVRKLKCGYNGKIHQIHHCFGDEIYSFVILNRDDHINLHRKFGNLNENCLLTNENVKKFIQNCQHILVVNGEIIENTMKFKSSAVAK
jgi:hypothetical protein